MKSILIVDDQNEVRCQANSLLRELGLLPLAVFEASTAAEAVQLATQHHPSLILLDVVLPDGTGFDVLRMLRKLGLDPRTVMMTAFPQFDYALEAANSKVSGFVVKPLEKNQLGRAILAAQGAEDAQRQKYLAFTMLDVYLKGGQYNLKLDEMRESTGINRLHGAYYMALIASLESDVTLESSILRFWELLRRAGLDSVNYLQDTAAMVVLLRDDQPRRLIPVLEKALREAFGTFCSGCAWVKAEQGLRAVYQNAAFARKHAGTAGWKNQVICYGDLDVAGILLEERRSGLLSRDGGQVDQLLVEFTRLNVASAQAAKALVHFCAQEGLALELPPEASLRQVGVALKEALSRKNESDEGRKNFAQLARAKQYIAEHCMENISRATVAHALDISYSYLGELFRTETDQSVTEYIQGLKMGKAVELLAGTRLSIGEIALRLGYPDSRSFIRAFLKRYQVTPGEWRMQKRDEGK